MKHLVIAASNALHRAADFVLVFAQSDKDEALANLQKERLEAIEEAERSKDRAFQAEIERDKAKREASAVIEDYEKVRDLLNRANLFGPSSLLVSNRVSFAISELLRIQHEADEAAKHRRESEDKARETIAGLRKDLARLEEEYRDTREKLFGARIELQRATAWTSVSDDLPDEGFEVLVAEGSGTRFLAKLIEGVWRETAGGPPLKRVTHWFPLPDKPGTEEREIAF